MKWLFRLFLFACVLLTAGSSHHLLSFPKFKPGFYVGTSKHSYFANASLTPVKPVRDTRVFQLVEDEEDDVSSRTKKITQYANILFTVLSASALIFLFQSRVKNQPDCRHLALNSHHRYIQLRTIRI